MSKPILCLDFDGVIHQYTSKWTKADEILDHVTPGFFDWALQAKEHFKLVIYSSRSKDSKAVDAMREWIGNELIEWDSNCLSDDPPLHPGDFEFAHEKPTAFLTVDDRAVCFYGDWSNPILEPSRLINFKPWNKR